VFWISYAITLVLGTAVAIVAFLIRALFWLVRFPWRTSPPAALRRMRFPVLNLTRR
jgi:hypothetical protein